MIIGHKDIFWNYLATFLKIASSAILLPFILRMMSSETVGIWTIFATISSMVVLFDFGFNPSFSRNVTYIFSGVKELKVSGYSTVNSTDNLVVDYGLLKGLLLSMKWFYLRLALFFFILLISVGTYYIHILLNNYQGSHQDVYVSWVLLCVISTYNLYTLYYDSLLQGKGLIKRSKQIVIIGQILYLVVAALLIIKGFGLIAIVSAQIVSVLIIRYLSYNAFFTKEMKQLLNNVTPSPQLEMLRVIAPNALKLGFTALGGFLVSRSSIVIGSLYLSLSQIASYGITIQFVSVISALSSIYIATYQPIISQFRITEISHKIKRLYLKGEFILIFTFILGGLGLIITGPYLLDLIGSKTSLLPIPILLATILVTFLEVNHSTAGVILATKNEVPFFRASLLSGFATVVLLFIFLLYFKLSLWALILAPGIAQGVYQNWKWPYEVVKDLNIHFSDIKSTFFNKLKLSNEIPKNQ